MDKKKITIIAVSAATAVLLVVGGVTTALSSKPAPTAQETVAVQEETIVRSHQIEGITATLSC